MKEINRQLLRTKGRWRKCLVFITRQAYPCFFFVFSLKQFQWSWVCTGKCFFSGDFTQNDVSLVSYNLICKKAGGRNVYICKSFRYRKWSLYVRHREIQFWQGNNKCLNLDFGAFFSVFYSLLYKFKCDKIKVNKIRKGKSLKVVRMNGSILEKDANVKIR